MLLPAHSAVRVSFRVNLLLQQLSDEPGTYGGYGVVVESEHGVIVATIPVPPV